MQTNRWKKDLPEFERMLADALKASVLQKETSGRCKSDIVGSNCQRGASAQIIE